ncbi:MAG: DUF3336 domain-containing protein [Abyssibacter sp.]|uniref:DUF3336 domain-containing protein n=1 Tax=Abyssibacter sp. TaxID=2320200 RepID=UPI0032192288
MTRRTRTLHRTLEHATTHAEWHAAAQALDAVTGAADWRADDDSPELASDLIRRDIARFDALRQAEDWTGLAASLYESIYRHQGDLTAHHLYGVARAGTKQIVQDYLDAVARALQAYANAPATPEQAADRLARLRAAEANLGRPALLLSGGAAMGFFHLGVIKALLEQSLLPEVICGSSIGSMVAAAVCNRSDDELNALFADLDAIYRLGIRFVSPRRAWQQGGLLDQIQYRRCALENIGDTTFAEAYARSGRALCISVSPSRARQKPRVLSARTSPDVLVADAVVASSAVPGLFPPVTLQARGPGGDCAPYLPEERWVDGTFQGDLPTKRLGRLYNVNHFIVSQVNPHAVPFLASRGGQGLPALAADWALSSARVQTVQTLKVLQARVKRDGLHNVLEHARLLAEQDYRGDTNIHPPMNAWMYRKLLSNPSVDDLHRYILLGERATWPQLALIRNQTRIQRELAAAIARLESGIG